MEEIWKEIEGSDGLFSVSNLGRIRQNHYEYISLQNRKITREEKIIEPGIWQSRYLRVDLQSNRKQRKFRICAYVHKLVAEAFLGPRPDGHVIDHIDGNHLNNRADNLRYITQKENINTSIAQKRRKLGVQNLQNDPIRRKQWLEKIKKNTTIAMYRPDVQEKLRKPKSKRHAILNHNQ